MRHSFATHFMETTKDPIALKGILGHSTMKMTDKYAKVTDRTIFDGMTKFKNAIEKPASPTDPVYKADAIVSRMQFHIF